MIYKYEFLDSAIRELDNLDQIIVQKILKRFKERVIEQEDPTIYPKPLKKELFGLWRLRIDDYRIIFCIVEDKRIVQITRVGYRSNIYK